MLSYILNRLTVASDLMSGLAPLKLESAMSPCQTVSERVRYLIRDQSQDTNISINPG